MRCMFKIEHFCWVSLWDFIWFGPCHFSLFVASKISLCLLLANRKSEIKLFRAKIRLAILWVYCLNLAVSFVASCAHRYSSNSFIDCTLSDFRKSRFSVRLCFGLSQEPLSLWSYLRKEYRRYLYSDNASFFFWTTAKLAINWIKQRAIIFICKE